MQMHFAAIAQMITELLDRSPICLLTLTRMMIPLISGLDTRGEYCRLAEIRQSMPSSHDRRLEVIVNHGLKEVWNAQPPLHLPSSLLALIRWRDVLPSPSTPNLHTTTTTTTTTTAMASSPHSPSSFQHGSRSSSIFILLYSHNYVVR
jgi:hypothetical protein